jgi:hypothetical protein
MFFFESDAKIFYAIFTKEKFPNRSTWLTNINFEYLFFPFEK